MAMVDSDEVQAACSVAAKYHVKSAALISRQIIIEMLTAAQTVRERKTRFERMRQNAQE